MMVLGIPCFVIVFRNVVIPTLQVSRLHKLSLEDSPPFDREEVPGGSLYL